MLEFQFLITASIIGSGLLFGPGAVTVVSVLWCIETVAVVFMPWVMAIQFVNIAISFLIGKVVGGIRNFIRNLFR